MNCVGTGFKEKTLRVGKLKEFLLDMARDSKSEGTEQQYRTKSSQKCAVP